MSGASSLIITDEKIDELLDELALAFIRHREAYELFKGSRGQFHRRIRQWLDSLPRDIHDHRNFRLPTGKTEDDRT